MRASENKYRLLNRDGSFNVRRVGIRRARMSDLYHWLLSMPPSVFLGVLAIVFMMTNAVFAVGYLAAGPGALEGAVGVTCWDRFSEAFFFSVQTLDTIGYGKLAPHGWVANWLVTLEALCGLMGLALATGLLFARFSRPTARVTFSRVAIIGNHDGEPCLIFRMANKRLNQIIEANVSVSIAKMERTKEGQEFRTFTDLTLERSRSPIFALTWTVVHPITKDSPLHGATPESLAAEGAEVIVSLIGTDDVFAQTVHARYSYFDGDFVWNHSFKDMVFREGDRVRVELGQIHETIALV